MSALLKFADSDGLGEPISRDFKLVDISCIKIHERVRKDFGNIKELARSIKENGLLQPILVSPDYQLLAGHRRLLAHKRLKRKAILARIIDSESPRAIERAENEDRKDFTLSERAKAAVEYLKEIGNRRGRRTDLQLTADSPLVQKGESSRDAAAREAGFSSTTLFRDAKKVLESENPTLIEWMDTEQLAPSTCAVVARLPNAKLDSIIKEFIDDGGPNRARKWVSENRGKVERFVTGDETRVPLFPELEAKERAEFMAAAGSRSPADQARDRFNGIRKIVRSIWNGTLANDLHFVVRERDSLIPNDLNEFAALCGFAIQKLSDTVEALDPSWR